MTLSSPANPLRSMLVAMLLWLSAVATWAQTPALQPIPPLKARVTDQTATLSAQQLAALEAQLKALEDETGAQVAVLMVATTAPEDIAAYTWRVASSWKLGRKDIGDGSLIVVAKDDRRMRIEVARKLEGAIPDIQAGRIIDGAMKPRFRVDDYAGGLSAAIDQMSLLIRGEKLPAPAKQQSQSSSWSKPGLSAAPAVFRLSPRHCHCPRSLWPGTGLADCGRHRRCGGLFHHHQHADCGCSCLHGTVVYAVVQSLANEQWPLHQLWRRRRLG